MNTNSAAWISRCISITEPSRWTLTVRDSSGTSNGSLVDFWGKLKNRSPKFIFTIYKCGHRNVLSKRQVRMSIFHIINLKKKKIMDTGVPGFFFNKKLILDYHFCLKSGPVFLFQIFIIAPLPPPKGYKIVSLIINQ